MIVSSTLAIICQVLIFILCFSLIYFVCIKFLFKNKGSMVFYLPLACSVGLVIFIWVKSNPMLVVKNNQVYDKYVFWGTPSYTDSEGKVYECPKMPVTHDANLLLNETTETFVLEYINYGTSLFTKSPEVINPGSSKFVYRLPDYFPNEEPPESIKVSVPKGSTSSGSTERAWLHKYVDYEEPEEEEVIEPPSTE